MIPVPAFYAAITAAWLVGFSLGLAIGRMVAG